MKNKNKPKQKIWITILFLGIFLIFIVTGKSETALNTGGEINAPALILSEENPIETSQIIETTLSPEDLENSILINIDELNQENLQNNSDSKNETTLNTGGEINAPALILSGNQTIKTENSSDSQNTSEQITENNKKPNEKTAIENRNQSAPSQEEFILSKQNPKKPEEEKIKIELFDKGEVVIEGEVPKDFPLEIKKQEKESLNKETWTKEVTISSKTHLEDPLIVYTNINEIPENKKQSIKIYWKTEKNQEVEILNFYDRDSNGLYDKISWEVPHLSEQVFEIIIDFTEGDNSSTNLEISITAPPDQTTNPISFRVTASYNDLDNVNCNIIIDKSLPSKQVFGPYPFTETEIIELSELNDGPHTWDINCSDSENTSKNACEKGNFIINESIQEITLDSVYLLGEIVQFTIPDGYSETEIKITKPATSPVTTLNTSNTTIIKLGSDLIDREGVYSLEISSTGLNKPIYKTTKQFSVVKMTLTTNKNNIETGETININIEINSPGEKIYLYKLDFGDNSLGIIDFNLDTNLVDESISHKYNSDGNFTLKLTAVMNNRKEFSIQKNGIYVTDVGDNEDPEVTLIAPKNNELLKKEPITLTYEVTDDSKVDNCTFELYIIKDGTESLDYNHVYKNIEKNKEIDIIMRDFEESDYSWYIFCCDNESNCNGELENNKEFTVSFSNTTNPGNDITHDYTEEIEDLINMIESFIEKQDSYELKEKEVIEDLNILEELTYNKKRLIQIDQDLGNNIKFIKDADTKEKRKQELIDELEEIKQQIPIEIKVMNSNEYVKNSLTQDLTVILQDYFDSIQKKISKKEIKMLSDENYEIQKYITVSTNIKQVKITYENSNKEITLITKDLSLKNNSFEIILEVIPKKIIENASEVIFITNSRTINEDPLFEIAIDKLENDKIIYYFEKIIDLKESEEIETILFKEVVIKKVGITGFSILELDITGKLFYYILFLIFLIVIIYVVFILIQRIRIAKWKKQENAIRIFKLIKESKNNLRTNDLETAREKYHKIQENYPLIPKSCKKYIYKDLRKIRVGIDKRDIFDLIKEYQESKKQGRKEDEDRLYKSIQSTYKRLPKKYRQKVYQIMFKDPLEDFL